MDLKDRVASSQAVLDLTGSVGAIKDSQATGQYDQSQGEFEERRVQWPGAI